MNGHRHGRRLAASKRADGRPSSSARGYNRAWEKLKDQVIGEYLRAGLPCPLCGLPLVAERFSIHVDHIKRLSEGGTNDRSNLRVLHAKCHRRLTSSEEQDKNRGWSTATDANGYPVDPDHPFNQ